MTEYPLDTLNLDDLFLQFKLMRAMGYKSLFDPEFRRELRNPIRRALYYKIIMYENNIDNQTLFNILDTISDKINFFQNPEMYQKFKQAVERKELMYPGVAQEKVQLAKNNMDRALEKYVPMSKEDEQQVAHILKRN